MRHRWTLKWSIVTDEGGRELYYAMDIVPNLTETEAYEYVQQQSNLLVERCRVDWPQTKAALKWAALAADPHVIQMSGLKVVTPDR